MPNDLVMAPAGARRLVTRSDFDGLVCAALLKELGILEDILFVHPKDVQDGKVELTASDITTNLPYSPEVALSFDHHSSEDVRVTEDAGNRVADSSADSAAFATTCGGKSWACAMNAAPIAEATPISAWQPPSAPDSVALCLHR